MTTRYLDFTGGNDGNDGSSFANRKLTLASAVSGLTGGDTVRVMASAAATSLGQNATWTAASQTVTLTTAVTANITDCESAWTASANVTSTASSATYRENANSANHVIAAGFTTGLASYFATGTLNLSAYQQVSFWIRSTGTHVAGVFQLKLCSDTAGVTAVNTISVPALTASYWTPVTVDTAGALGSAIASVALYCVSDPGAVTVNIDNILACKASSSADSLTLTSLISLNTDSNEPWFAIKSINGTSIKLGCGDAFTATAANHTTLYMGSTVTTTTYKREAIMLTALQASSANGTNLDSPINIEGGWDTSAMSSQSDITWLRAKDPSLGCIQITGTSNRIHKIYVCAGGTYGLQLSSASYGTVDEFGAAGCRYGLQIASATANPRVNDARYATGCEIGINMTGVTGRDWILKIKKIWGAGTSATSVPEGITGNSNAMGSIRIYADEIRNCRSGLDISSSTLEVYGCVMSNNTTDVTSSGHTLHKFLNCSLVAPTNTGTRSLHNKFGQTANDHRMYWEDSGLSIIASATDQRHTASDIAWKFSPKTANALINSSTPMALSVGKIACPSGEARTVTLYVRRDSTSLSMRLRVPGGQIAGVASDVTASAAGSANTWEQLSVSFTPSEAGVVEVFADAWGGTTLNGWVDDLTIS